MAKLFATSKKNMFTVIALAVVLLFPLVCSMFEGSRYVLIVAVLMCIYCVAVSGLDISYGYCGQISLGHAGFFAIGAYGSALINIYLGIPVIFSMILSAIAAAIVGVIVAWPASKLVFHFLSLSTIAFGEIIFVLISQSPGGITNDYRGLRPASINLLGYELKSYTVLLYFGIACVLIFVLVKSTITNSKYGRAFIAIRENVHAANGMGINVRLYKTIAFCIGAFFTGFAGSMYGHMINFISPETFNSDQSTIFITMLLLGGTASTVGPLIGVILVKIIMECLRFSGQYNIFLYAVFLLLIVLFMPEGILSVIKKRYQKYVSRKEE